MTDEEKTIKLKTMDIVLLNTIENRDLSQNSKLKILKSLKNHIQENIDNIEQDLIDQKWSGFGA
jgi:hypothetical protein